MTDLTTDAIEFSVFEWKESTAEKLQIGSRFRFVKEKHGRDELFVVLTISDSCIAVFSTEWISEKVIETSFQSLSMKCSDVVLVVPWHEQTIKSSQPINA